MLNLPHIEPEICVSLEKQRKGGFYGSGAITNGDDLAHGHTHSTLKSRFEHFERTSSQRACSSSNSAREGKCRVLLSACWIETDI